MRNLAADFFEIDHASGNLRVKITNPEVEMDRDNGITEHIISIIVYDNNKTGIPLLAQTLVTLTLLDCNDNSPQMPETLNYRRIYENFPQDEDIVEFRAPDKDAGFNAQVDYLIKSINLVQHFGDNEPTNFENLFVITSINNDTAIIKTGINLRGFSGIWNVTIIARDRGALGDAGFSLESIKSYEITIDPFNFDAPRIVFPQNTESATVDIDQVRIGTTLTKLDGTSLAPFEAIDNDVGAFGDVTFKLASINGDHELFDIRKLDKSQSDLIVVRQAEERTYMVRKGKYVS